MAIHLEFKYAEIVRPMTPGQVRLRVRAFDENADPVAIFLCCVEPPNSFERRMRESFQTVCSVEDMVEYPVGVSVVSEYPPIDQAAGTILYCAQDNTVYIRGENESLEAAWIPYKAPDTGLPPNRHSHKLPFFRRSTLDIIIPNRLFFQKSVDWIRSVAKQLEEDMATLEELKLLGP